MKQKLDPSNKPYYRCLSCPRFRQTCAGLPTRDMTLQEWCEFICIVMDVFHLSNAYVAKEADASIKTMERIRARSYDQDIMRSTFRRIEIVVFGSATNHICCLDFEASNAVEKVAKLEAELAAVKEEAAYWRKESDRKAKMLDMFIELKNERKEV